MYLFVILFVIKIIFLIFHQRLIFRTSLLSLTVFDYSFLSPFSFAFLRAYNSTVMMSPTCSLLSFLNPHFHSSLGCGYCGTYICISSFSYLAVSHTCKYQDLGSTHPSLLLPSLSCSLVCCVSSYHSHCYHFVTDLGWCSIISQGCCDHLACYSRLNIRCLAWASTQRRASVTCLGLKRSWEIALS